jgi:hypothetical protein
MCTYLSIMMAVANRQSMRVRLQLNACLSAEPAGHGCDLVTEYEIRCASLTIAHAMTNPCKPLFVKPY